MELSHKCFYFSHFLLELHQGHIFLLSLIWCQIQKSLCVCPPTQRCFAAESVAILCTRSRGFLTTWAEDYATCDSARSCDKALFLEVVCMFDARMCMCLMVAICRATLPECWCVTLQHCLAYPVKLFPSSHFFSHCHTSLSSLWSADLCSL